MAQIPLATLQASFGPMPRVGEQCLEDRHSFPGTEPPRGRTLCLLFSLFLQEIISGERFFAAEILGSGRRRE
jgi:hypothetical protein